MSETKINASQTTITANDIGAAPVYDTMPTAAVGYLDKIVQFVGTTDANYTNGYFYKCVSDGQTPATYSWTQKAVQPSSGGSSYTAGSGIDITGSVISVKYPVITNTSTGSNSITILSSNAATGSQAINIGRNSSAGSYGSVVSIGYAASVNGNGAVAIGSGSISRLDGVAIGTNAKANPYSGTNAVAVGYNTDASGNNCISIGSEASSSGSSAIAIGTVNQATANLAIQLGGVGKTNNDANTFKVGNGNGNYEMMSADGTIPTDRFTTTPSADGTYVPTLTISSGTATRSWAAPSGGGSTALSLTLAAANWSNNSITVTATGVTASNNVIVAPAPASQADYTAAGIICTAQGAGTLTFTCTSTPSSDLTVNVLII